MSIVDKLVRSVKGHTLSYVHLATGCPLEEEEDFDEYIEIITEEITDILAKHLEGFKREKDYSLCNSSCSFSQFVSWY